MVRLHCRLEPKVRIVLSQIQRMRAQVAPSLQSRTNRDVQVKVGSHLNHGAAAADQEGRRGQDSATLSTPPPQAVVEGLNAKGGKQATARAR